MMDLALSLFSFEPFRYKLNDRALAIASSCARPSHFRSTSQVSDNSQQRLVTHFKNAHHLT